MNYHHLWALEIERIMKRKLLFPIEPTPKPTLWKRITYYAWRKWWYAYTDWLHRDCDR